MIGWLELLTYPITAVITHPRRQAQLIAHKPAGVEQGAAAAAGPSLAASVPAAGPSLAASDDCVAILEEALNQLLESLHIARTSKEVASVIVLIGKAVEYLLEGADRARVARQVP